MFEESMLSKAIQPVRLFTPIMVEWNDYHWDYGPIVGLPFNRAASLLDTYRFEPSHRRAPNVFLVHGELEHFLHTEKRVEHVTPERSKEIVGERFVLGPVDEVNLGGTVHRPERAVRANSDERRSRRVAVPNDVSLRV
jgi:hypothetical protein